MLEPEGFLVVNGLRIFYRSEGGDSGDTILGLHGGPGGSYDYLAPLFDLSSPEHRVVLFDQGGGGKSEVPKDRARYTVENFVEEVEGVRRALKLGKVHLYGHSWGGMLAQAYALKYQSNLRGLILSGTTSSVPALDSEVERLFLTLSPDTRKTVIKYESRRDFENPEYVKALDEFNRKFQCKLDPWPETLKFAFEHFSRPVGETMFGPYLVKTTGNMRYWNVTDRLATLRLPCLILCGDRDFLTPRLHRTIHARVKGSKLVIFKGLTHSSLWEDRAAYAGAIRSFLDSI